jgi:hypothetical protein
MVQEVTTTSWGKRIINAFWGVLFGIALIIGAFYLVFWNEGNALHTQQALEQTSKVVIPVANTPVDAKNDMRAIYFSGTATTDNILMDKILTISEKAIQLNRKVEMYQWVQETETKTEKQVGGSEQEIKTYTYKKQWSPELINSSDFKEQAGHENPANMPLKSKVQYASVVTVGDFTLPNELIKQISGDKTVDVSKVDVDGLKSRFNKPVQAQEEGLYVGDDAQAPKIGDMRISVTAVYPETVSVIGQQTGKTVQPYMTKAGHAVFLIEVGQVSSQQMIHEAEAENRAIMWLLRLLSLVMMIIGLALIMAPIAVLADFLPFLGGLVGAGTGFIAFAVGICLWVIGFSIAWFMVRPVMAACFIVLAIVGSFTVVRYKRR